MRASRSIIVSLVCVAAVGGMAANGRTAHGAIGLEPGLWQVTELDRPNNRSRAICLADVDPLVQLEHGNSICSHLLLARDARTLTVHYSCPRRGFGRTVLKLRTRQVARLDTQGILADTPFAYSAEARRIGSCKSAGARRRLP